MHLGNNMSKRKGISANEKRVRMLQLFYEKKEFYQLKDLEKIAPKEKGIVAQSVKYITQTLVDDGLIDTDKIGTSIYFWSFPGKSIKANEKRIEDITKNLLALEIELAKIHQEILNEKTGKEDTIARQKIMQEITMLQRKENQLQKEVAKHGENEPKAIAQMSETAQKYKDAANVWTDNVFAIQRWCKNKFDISEADLNKQFNISRDLDYIE